MQFCTHCGSPVKPGQAFCESCGAPLPESAPAASPASPLSPARPGAGISPSQFRILGIAAIILVIAAGGFLVLSGSLPSAKTPAVAGASENAGILSVNGQCSAGLTLCKGTCVDLKTNTGNCGACGFAVPVDQTCRDGKFSSLSDKGDSGSLPKTAVTTPDATPVSCPSGQTSCSGICRNLLGDTENCGSCKNSCLSGQACQNGRCLVPGTTVPVVSTTVPVTVTPDLFCSSGQIVCNGACVDVFTDKKNCGVCGRTCKSQEVCINAQCGPACTNSGDTLCDDTCVNLKTDVKNCGACGTTCTGFPPNTLGSSCAQGTCYLSGCKSGYADCNKIVSDGCEVNLRSDNNNCGSCGAACTAGKTCSLDECK